jgi:hypothetical protein
MGGEFIAMLRISDFLLSPAAAGIFRYWNVWCEWFDNRAILQ